MTNEETAVKIALSVGDERFVVTGTRQQLIDQVLTPMALAITSAESAEEKPCELGWGCTDLLLPVRAHDVRVPGHDAGNRRDGRLHELSQADR